MKITVQTVAFLIVVFLVVFGGYWSWWLERHVHYSWSYKSMVEQTVRDLVKPEALKP